MDIERLRELERHEADANLTMHDKTPLGPGAVGQTALMLAAERGHSKVVQALTKAPYLAAPNLAAADGSTALIAVCSAPETVVSPDARQRVVDLLLA